MGTRKPKIPDCVCAICLKWNHDAQTLNEFFIEEARRGNLPMDLRKFYAQLEDSKGCELCGSDDSIGLLWIPQSIRDFFKIERLCVWCRAKINSVSQTYEWPICWGSTSDDELKWFLAMFVYAEFKEHFYGRSHEFVMYLSCCVEGTHARRARIKPEPYVWPKWDDVDEIPEEIDIQIKPRIRLRESKSTEATP